MDSLESLPPEDSDVYIPNLSSVQTQYSSSSPTLTESTQQQQQQQQSMQMSAIRYTSPAAAAAVAGISPALVAAQGPNGVLHGFYRTTLTTQVIAAQTLAQTFQYPPTPPVDGSLEGSNGERRYLQQPTEGQALTPSSQGVMDGDIPVSAGYEKSANPFPSPLPTPPDVQVMHSQQSSHVSQEQPPQQPPMVREEHQPSATKGLTGPQPHQQWAPSNMQYFMPQTSSSHCNPLVSYNGNACHNSTMGLAARRGCPPGQMPCLQQVYPAAAALGGGSMGVANGSGNDAVMGGDMMMKKMPAVPALVKDGEDLEVFWIFGMA